VAGGTGSPLPCAGLNQRLAFLNAAHGNVGDEAGVVVAEFGLCFEDFRSFDDALRDRLRCARIGSHQHPSGDVSFWDSVGFDHANPRLWPDCGEVFGGGFYLLVVALVSNAIMARVGPCFGSELLRRPLLKSASC